MASSLAFLDCAQLPDQVLLCCRVKNQISIIINLNCPLTAILNFAIIPVLTGRDVHNRKYNRCNSKPIKQKL